MSGIATGNRDHPPVASLDRPSNRSHEPTASSAASTTGSGCRQANRLFDIEDAGVEERIQAEVMAFLNPAIAE
jgi:hypothetical protein